MDRKFINWGIACLVVSLIAGTVAYKSLIPTYDMFLEKVIPKHDDVISDRPNYDTNHSCYRRIIHPKEMNTKDYKGCADKASQQTYDYIKDKRDISAQEGMWRAATQLLKLTAFQFIALVVSMVLSAAGLVALLFTLRSTQDVVIQAQRTNDAAEASNNFALTEAEKADARIEASIKESREARILELQPYLSIVSFGSEAVVFVGNENTLNFIINITLKNHGQTPAQKVYMEITSWEVTTQDVNNRQAGNTPHHPNPSSYRLKEQINPRDVIHPSFTSSSTVMVGQHKDASLQDTIQYHIKGFIRYQGYGTAGTDEHRFIKFNAGGGKGTQGDIIEIIEDGTGDSISWNRAEQQAKRQ